MSKHILSSFEESLSSLNTDIAEMGRMALELVSLAERCALDDDAGSCAEVEVRDSRVDEFEKAVDSAGIGIITKFQPVASDLRTVIVAMKVSSDLERIADLAVSVSRRARKISGAGLGEFAPRLRRAFEIAREMIRSALDARAGGQPDAAAFVIGKDAVLDALCKEIDAQISATVAGDTSNAADLVQLAIIIRNLERMGDHAKNIAEDAVFLATGRDIRHSGRAGRAAPGAA